jgi:hypothetical protein
MFEGKDNLIFDELRGVIPGVAVEKGEAVLHNDVFGFYGNDESDITKPVILYYRMRQVLADKGTGTAEAIEQGDRLYYFPATGLVSATPGTTVGVDYYFCGWAKKAAGANDTTVLMNFDGTLWDTVA